MDLFALDFETATAEMDSPCELGIAVVREGVVRQVYNWLIKPRQWPFFSPFNVAVHGIRPEEVADAPEWREVWQEAGKVIAGGIVVAHNASFDMNVIRRTMAGHAMPHTEFRYFCSVSMARRVWPGRRRYDLASLCADHGIPLRHHRAGQDAEATAELVLRAADRYAVSTTEEFLDRAGVKRGSFTRDGHLTPGGKFTPRS